MRPIIRFSMKNAVAIFLLMAVLIASGMYSMSLMKTEKYPNIDIPYYTVILTYPGASSKQVLNELGKPLEAALSNLEGIENVYMYAYPNSLFVTTQFGMSVVMKEAQRAVQDEVSKLLKPEGVREPQYIEQKPENPELIVLALSGADESVLRSFVEDSLKPAWQAIHGVDTVNVAGIVKKRMNVRVKPDKLTALHLSLDQVKQMLQSYQLNFPIGDVTIGDEKLPIRSDRELSSIQEVRNVALPLPMQANTFSPQMKIREVKIGEIADVSLDPVADSALTRLNGKEAVLVSIVPKTGEDAVKIANEAREKADLLTIPSGMNLVWTKDQSADIEKSVNNMLREVALGALMAVIVTLLFLRNIRSTIIAILSIPLSMFASFIVLNKLGYTLNIMTLAGIAVAIGRVVDDSIVVIENIFRRIRSTKERNHELVEESTTEVSNAITSSTITTVAVFIPLAFVPGIVGRFFEPLAWTIVISLLFSLLVAVSVVPLLSRLFLLRMRPHADRENMLQHGYRALLTWALKNRALTLVIATVLLVSVVGFFGTKIGFNFLPAEKVLHYQARIQMPLGTMITRTEMVAKRVLRAVEVEPGFDHIVSQINNETATISFVVKDEITDVTPLEDALRVRLSNVKGAKSISLAGQGGPGDNNISIVVNGPDKKTISDATDKIVQKLRTLDGLADVRSTVEGEKPEIELKMDDKKLTQNGLTPGIVNLGLRNMIEGNKISELQIDGQSVDLQLSLKVKPSDSFDVLNAQTITNILGQPVKLGDVAVLKRVLNPLSIDHMNQKEFLQVNGKITSPNASEVNGKVKEAIESLGLPPSITTETLGAAKEMNDGFVSMGIALAASIVLVFLVMIISFGEATVPFVILFAIPFSLIGAVLGLYSVNEPIGMPALIGLLMLNGIVVTNAIVLLERVKQNVDKGMGKTEALMEAGAVRLRPILMTAIATIGALFPLALSTDAGLISRSLAVVVIGGLSTSTLLTLVIVPVLYSLFKRIPRRRVQLIKPDVA